MLAAGCILVGGCSTAPDASTSRTDTHDGSVTVETTAFSSLRRLTPSVDLTEGGAPPTLMAARGEREGFQVVAWADRGSPRLVVLTGSLRGPGDARISARHVKAYIEQPMTVDRGSPAGRRGIYVDPLVPAAHRDVVLGPTNRLLMWVDVAVPVGATPGSYAGTVELRTSTKRGQAAEGPDGLLASVPVRVVVRAATLPDTPTLASSIGVDASQIERFEHVAAGSPELRAATEHYARTLADARLSIADVGVLPPGTLPGHTSAVGDAAYLERVFGRRGVASVRIPFYMDYPFADPLGTDRPAALAYLRRAAAWAQKHGWLDRAYVYAIDEPDDSRAGEVRELHELVHAANPKLRLLVTREASATAFAGSVDIWTPNINATRFRRSDVVRQARAGRATWWYPSVTTFQPQPTLFIDELRPTPRALGWLAWRMGVRGILYWSATHWHDVEDPYHDTATFRETDVVGNGDGVLLYPGAPIGRPGLPSPSIRLLQLRDGIEDHDLLTLATCHGSAADRVRLQRLAALVAPSMTHVVPTPVQVQALRSAAFATLDRAVRAKRYVAGSTAAACAAR